MCGPKVGGTFLVIYVHGYLFVESHFFLEGTIPWCVPPMCGPRVRGNTFGQFVYFVFAAIGVSSRVQWVVITLHEV